MTHSHKLLSEISSTLSSTRLWIESAQLGIASSIAFTMSLTLCATSEICATCFGFAQCCLVRWCLVHRLPALLPLFKVPLSTCLGTLRGGAQTIASSSSTRLFEAPSFDCFALYLTAVAPSFRAARLTSTSPAKATYTPLEAPSAHWCPSFAWCYVRPASSLHVPSWTLQ